MSLLNPKVRRAALAFIFVTAVLDIVAMGIVIPVLPGLSFYIAAAVLGLGAAFGWLTVRKGREEEQRSEAGAV